MQVTIVGKQVVSYTKRDTGELKEGISLYYTAPDDRVEGLSCADLWVGIQSKLYAAVKALDVSKPLAADLYYEVRPGSRFPVLERIDLVES
jgi:hypothetical protein